MEKTKQKSIRLNVLLIDKIEKMSKEQNRTFNNMVETILIDYIEKNNFKTFNSNQTKFHCSDCGSNIMCKSCLRNMIIPNG